MADRPLAEIPLGRDVLRITRETDHGRATVSLRRWFATASGELRPGREGLSVNPSDLGALLAALEAVQHRMTGAGAL